jgi:hypothetical protein
MNEDPTLMELNPIADDVDLASDPFADDLSAELAARAPRRYATRTTAVLAGLVLAVGGFLAGAQVQKHFGTPAAGSSQDSSSQSRSGRSSANFADGNFGGGRQGGAAPQASAAATSLTTGTVKLMDGSTVYVETADGNLVTVRTNGSTAVQVTGALTDLKPGTQVSVEGPAGGDGIVTATKVTKAK